MLRELIEPPDTEAAAESMVTLWKWGMLERPLDSPLTPVGGLAAALPVDYRLTRMLALSLRLDCVREAIVIVSALTLGRPVWRLTSTLIHTNPDEYNEIVRKTFFSRHEFEQGMSSEMFSAVNLYCRLLPLMEVDGGSGKDKDGFQPADSPRHLRFGRKAEQFCRQHSLAKKEVEGLCMQVWELERKLSAHLQQPINHFKLQTGSNFPPPDAVLASEKLRLLRVLMVWSFPDMIVTAAGVGLAAAQDANQVQLGSKLSDKDIDRLLKPSPLTWMAVLRGADIVHVKGASAVNDANVRPLLEWLRPDWVFLRRPASVVIWMRAGDVREEIMKRKLPSLITLLQSNRRDVVLNSEGDDMYIRLESSIGSNSEKKQLEMFRSRRGVGNTQRVADLSVQDNGQAACTISNCESLSQGEGVEAMLTPTGKHLLSQLFGGQAQLALTAAQGGERQMMICFDEQHKLPRSSLIRNRHPGVDLMATIASGWKDRCLRVRGYKNGQAVVKEVRTSCDMGLKWKHHGHGLDAMLGRHSLLKVAMPLDEQLSAVGASVMIIGDRLVAVEGATLLPPGYQWLQLVSECVSNGPNTAGCCKSYCELSEEQHATSARVRMLVDQHAMVVSPELILALNHMLEPYESPVIVDDGDTEDRMGPITEMFHSGMRISDASGVLNGRGKGGGKGNFDRFGGGRGRSKSSAGSSHFVNGGSKGFFYSFGGGGTGRGRNGGRGAGKGGRGGKGGRR